MNRIYRLVWSCTRRMLVPVSEFAHVHAKGSTGRTTLGRNLCRIVPAFTLLLLPGVALAAPPRTPSAARSAVHQVLNGNVLRTTTPAPASNLPSGGQVVAGQASISQNGATLTINQSTQKAVLNWQSFNIGSGNTVDFIQPGVSSIALNRVLGSDASRIFGHLNANGQVFLINPNGVLFAPGTEVNVAGLIASTLDLSDQDFLNGNYHFNGTSDASVINQGNITAAPGGYVAFIAHEVSNDGMIATPGGTAALGAGSSVDLKLAGNQLLSFRVSGATLNALAQNGGIIQANDGAVILSAQAKDALLQTVVNNTGIVRAQTMVSHNGTIELLGGASGTVQVAGTLDASAPSGGQGGNIETSGAHLKVANDATITTKSTTGNDGQWLIDPNDFTIAASGGDMTGAVLSSSLGSGNVTIQSSSGASGSNGDINIDDTVTWSANTLTLEAYRNININTAMNGSGTAGLALMYGQGSFDGVIGGQTATYNVNAPVNLASTGSFSTTLGTIGAQIPYTIITSLGAAGSTTGTDLQGIGANTTTLAGHYVLGADINASATSSWNSGAGFNPIGNNSNNFTGVFDGLGHAISDLHINRSSTSDVGLFGSIKGATLRNTGLVALSVSGTSNVGGLAGSAFNDATIANSFVTGSVTGTGIVGTLIGSSTSSSTITNSYAAGSVSGSSNVGGLVGFNGTNSVISRSYATASVLGGDYAGGLVGSNALATVVDSYATGSVTGGNAVGGLIGTNGPSAVSNSYATGHVTGTGDVGGLVGHNGANGITSAYWDTTTSGQAVGIGGGTTTGATGLSTAILASALPAGFDGSVWANGGNQTTPYLLANASFGTITGSVILGSDTSATPTVYNVIATLQQLQNINTTGLAADYVLGNDIDASATSGWNSGAGFAPIGDDSSNAFKGVFDGLGHTIDKLAINRPSSNNIGLFGNTSNATIRNTGLTEASVTGNRNVGGLAGYSTNTTISNAYVTGVVSGGVIPGASHTVGGLLGYAGMSLIENSYAAVTASGTSNIGGLVGTNSNGAITGSYATGSVSGSTEVGGLVGVNWYNGTVSNSYATGSVHGLSEDAGGLIGSNQGGSIITSYATGQVTGAKLVGGLVGYSSNGVISGSYATGSASGTLDVGGLVGNNTNSPISNSYATGSVTGSNDAGGLIGSNRLSAINTSYATGFVSGAGKVGGLVGSNYGSTLKNSYATGSVTGTTNVGGLVGSSGPTSLIATSYATGSVSGIRNSGGLAGSNGGTIASSYATGPTSATGLVAGGLVGTNTGTILDSYATGPSTGSVWTGGLVGSNSSGTVTNSYWDMTTSGQANGAGGGSLSGMTGLTTAQLGTALPSEFSSSVWANGDNQTTPYLVADSAFGTVSGAVILGSDTSATPTVYNVITTLQQLQNINTTGLAGSYVLGNNIDASATSGWNGGVGFAPIGSATNAAFRGTFNGLGYQISNLTINRPTSSRVGLFGATSGARINAVQLIDENVVGNQVVGGLAGSNEGTTVSNSHVTGSIAGSGGDTGGLIGYNGSNSTVASSYATATVSGGSATGGLIGANGSNSSTINSYATGSVTGSAYVGGLVGSNGSNSTIAGSYATGSVTGVSRVGGLLGSNWGSTVTTSYATGSVSGGIDVGGLIGLSSSNGSVSTNFAIGPVTGSTNVGGLIGSYFGNPVTNSYWDSTTAGVADNGIGTARTTAQLGAALPAGFSSSVWANGDNQTTPYLVADSQFGTVSGAVILGSDTSATPTVYNVITTLQQLQNINTTGLAGDYVLGKDIDAAATSSWNGGAGFAPLGNSSTRFTGIFDGLGHSISNLTINRPGTSDVGLFSETENAQLRNVKLAGDNVIGDNSVGALAGFTLSTTITNAYASGSVSGSSNVGGLSGSNYNTTINESYTTGSVSGGQNVGGLAGYSGTSNGSGTLVNDHAEASVSGTFGVGGLVGFNSNGAISGGYATGSVSGTNAVGGLAGSNEGGTISRSYATGAVTGGSDVGGLAGYSSNAVVSGSYATGQVSGGINTGGLVGYSTNSAVNNSYASGSVSGLSNVGGLVGSNMDNSSIAHSYAVGSVTGSSNSGGLIGNNTSNSTVTDSYWDKDSSGQANGIGANTGGAVTLTGLSDAQMKQGVNFTGFDFTNTWVIYDGHTDPLLRAFMTPLTVTSLNQTQTYTGGTFGLSNPVYSVPGADTSGHLFGIADPYAGARNVGTYTAQNLWSDQQGYIISYSGGTLTINPRPVTLTAPQVTKIYDGGTGYTVTAADLAALSGALVGGDTVTSATITYTNKNAGTADKGATLSGVNVDDGNGGNNYILTLAGNSDSTINPAALTLQNLSAANKVYDATDAATATAALNGIIGSDTVTDSLSASFDNKNVENNKTVTVNGITLGGTDAGNYTIGTGQTTTADITPAALTLIAGTGTKTYDGNTGSAGIVTVTGLQGSDTVTGLGESYDSKNVLGTNGSTLRVDSGYAINDGNGGANYTVTTQTAAGTINPATLTLQGLSAANKVYDGTDTATATALLNGVIGSDSVTDSLTATFDNKNIGNNKTVTINGITLGGSDAGNYMIRSGQTTTADITPASLTLQGLSAANKIYDGNTTADATASLGGIIGSDSVTDSLAATFDNKNAGNNKTVTVNGITLGGTDGGNYTIGSGQTTTADITPAPLTLMPSSDTKTYDATTGSTGTVAVTGLVGSDTITGLSQSFDSKDVMGANGSVLSVNSVYTVNDGNGGHNYTVAMQTAPGTIHPLTLMLTGLTVADKAADGSTAAIITNDGSLPGILSGDSVSLDGSQAAASFASPQPGLQTVNVTGLTLAGADAMNYLLASPQQTRAEITPANGGGGNTPPTQPAGLANAVGVANITAMAGYTDVVSGPAQTLDPKQSYTRIQGPGKSPQVNLSIENSGIHAPWANCTAAVAINPFAITAPPACMPQPEESKPGS